MEFYKDIMLISDGDGGDGELPSVDHRPWGKEDKIYNGYNIMM